MFKYYFINFVILNSCARRRLANGQNQINRTGFIGTGPRYRISLPEISKGSVQSLSYRIGIGLDRTGTGSYRIIVYR
ncbi:hypothetical protein H5410_064357 [Solanum commersonii]|uniref:Uncharacterized protein n=1 Tax=Solanum commersonii TaxID=4109 RepID=A0A9J5VZJ3_SOLCO|nr:hypothetical protein H5410_064357 [Solanum commersonii]